MAEGLPSFGKEVEFQAIRTQIEKGGDHLMPVFLSREQIETQGKEIENYRKQLFADEYMKEVRPFPCVRELFEKLRARGHRIALASSAKGDELEQYKRIARISDLLEAETSSDDARESKPDPDIFIAALRRLRSPGHDAIAVGDTPYDAEAAIKAGMTAVGMLSGGFPETSLTAAGCIEIYRDPADLLERYDRSVLARP